MKERRVIRISDAVGGTLAVYRHSFKTGREKDRYIFQSLFEGEIDGRVIVLEEGAALELYRALGVSLGIISD